MSDCWAAYSRLGSLGYRHQTVNHSQTFKDPITGACTNKIESNWHQVKLSLPHSGTSKDLYDGYFSEYCVHRKYLRDAPDKVVAFLRLIRRVYQCQRPGVDKENRAPVRHDDSVHDEHNYSGAWDTSMDLFD